MTGTIIPLRHKGEEASALAGFDMIAAEMLTEGRAVSLSAARTDVILTRLRAQRTELTAVRADLQARPPSGDVRIDAINASLIVAANKALVQIELSLQHAGRSA